MFFGMVISLHSGMVSAQKVTIDVKKASLVSVLEEIKRQTGYRYLFVGDQVREVNDITLSMKDQPVETVLDSCLRNTIWTYAISDKTIVLSLRAGTAVSKSRQPVKNEVVGIVKDKKGVPMIGVTVKLVNTTLGGSTNSKGFFKLLLPVKNGTLECSFIGYKTQKVEFTEKSDTLRIVMIEDVTGLDEVQVIAYGEQKKRTVISAISSVKADDIKELPTHSLESLLQGHMAGVEVNNLSGAPGGGGSIVAIRGYNSFFVDGEGGDREYGSPLYVVDGVPMQSFTSPITGTNMLSNLDPSMIESVEVLKDAASAAIYGSRAGNGVILITTKKGRSGQAKFTANVSYSASWIPETPVQSGGQLERWYNIRGLRNTVIPYQDVDGHWKVPTSYEEVWNFRGSELNQPTYDWFWGTPSQANHNQRLQDSLNVFYNNSTDWWKYAYRTAKVYNANLQASGGSEAIRYMIGAGYYKEEGIMYGSDFQRVNVMTNLSAHPSKRIRLDNSLSLSYSDRSRGGDRTGAKVEGVTVNPMLASTLHPGESYIKKELLKQLNSVIQKNHSYAARYNLVLDYEILRDLHLRLSGGIDYNQNNLNHFEPSTFDSHHHWSKSEGQVGRSISLLNENLLSYTFSIKQVHNFDILLGLSFQKDQGYSNNGSARKGPNDYVHYVSDFNAWGGANGNVNVADPKDPMAEPLYETAFRYTSDFEEERMNSYFGRLTYNFKEKYMLEATIRRDGSSVFGEKVRWATFPSVAVGWAFSEESWMKGLYWLSFGKIRASWGKSGQKFRQRYLAHGLMAGSGNTFLGNVGIVPDRRGGLINRKLTWEETDQYDVGLDVSLLDYRIRLTCDYYYRYTKGLLNQVDLSGDIYYHQFQWQNALGVSNEGLEVELTADIFRESTVKWRMKFNASRNWNRFRKSHDGWDFSGNVLGKPLYRMKVYKTDGFYNSMDEVPIYYLEADGMPKPLTGGGNYKVFFPGSRKIIDLNGDGKISDADQYYAASPLPLAHGGFINEITWKQFDLNLVFTYSLGRHIINAYSRINAQPNSGEGPIMGDVRKFNAWTSPGGGSYDFPRMQMYNGLPGQFGGTNDSDIEKVHMVRLKQLTLGYNLHDKIAKKIGLAGARLFLTTENLFLLTNYSGLDPEIVNITSGVDLMNSYPLPRKFTVGLTINF